MKNVQVVTRVPEDIKKRAAQVLKSQGLDIATLLRMKLYEVANTNELSPPPTTKDNSLGEKQAWLSDRIRKMYQDGKITRLKTNERGAVVIPKGHPLDEDWIREAWTI